MAEQQYAGEGAERPQGTIPENVVLVGKKPPMNYVLAVVTQFNNGVKSVKIRARGNSISRAVDVAEIARNRFVTDAKNPSKGNIAIGSEELSNEDGTKSKVSSLQIFLSKSGKSDMAAAKPENVVLIGKKPPMNYVLAVVTQFNNGVDGVMLRARGNSISRAVDVAEIARNRFVTDTINPSNDNIAIASEEIANEDGTKSKVSSIEITLEK
jgi:DNA-binding protein